MDKNPSRVDGKELLFGFSLPSIVAILIGIVLFAYYVKVLLFGENSLTVLRQVEKEKQILSAEKYRLQKENQQLQKRYFELLQITGN
ncbi:hypothetical protein [Nitratifractor sp.]